MDRVSLVFMLIIFFAVYGSANYLIAKRIYQWLRLIFQGINKKLYIGIYVLIAFSWIFVYLPLPESLTNFMNWIGAYWMGIFIYLFLFIVMVDLVVFFGGLFKVIPRPTPQRIRFYSGFIVILLTTSIVSYGIYNANQIKHVSYHIELTESDLSEEMTLILISDLHLGAVNSEKRLESIVENINKLEPDIVTIAGDIFNDDYYAIHNPDRAMDLLKSIKSTYGVYASLGNHDAGATFAEMVRFLEQSDIRLLNDEHVVIEDELILIGRVDPSPIGGFGGLQRKEMTDVLSQIDNTNLPIIVMDHTPTNLEQYDEQIDVVLAGHTHRGQIFPGNLITKAIFEVDYGQYQRDADSPHVIVTSGVGTWGMPMRVGTNNEIVSIHLQ